MPALESRPTLFADVVQYTDAFRVLTISRTITMGGEGSIPLSEIAAYCSLMEVDDKEAMIRLIQAMDMAYLETRKDGNES